jgi:chemotaxis protein histidine kinase CheA
MRGTRKTKRHHHTSKDKKDKHEHQHKKHKSESKKESRRHKKHTKHKSKDEKAAKRARKAEKAAKAARKAEKEAKAARKAEKAARKAKKEAKAARKAEKEAKAARKAKKEAKAARKAEEEAKAARKAETAVKAARKAEKAEKAARKAEKAEKAARKAEKPAKHKKHAHAETTHQGAHAGKEREHRHVHKEREPRHDQEQVQTQRRPEPGRWVRRVPQEPEAGRDKTQQHHTHRQPAAAGAQHHTHAHETQQRREPTVRTVRNIGGGLVMAPAKRRKPKSTFLTVTVNNMLSQRPYEKYCMQNAETFGTSKHLMLPAKQRLQRLHKWLTDQSTLLVGDLMLLQEMDEKELMAVLWKDLAKSGLQVHQDGELVIAWRSAEDALGGNPTPRPWKPGQHFQTLVFPNGLCVINTHFRGGSADRGAQMQQIMDEVTRLKREVPNAVFILGGDFNTRPHDRAFATIQQLAHDHGLKGPLHKLSTPTATVVGQKFTAGKEYETLDYVFVSDAQVIQNTAVVPEPAQWLAHCMRDDSSEASADFPPYYSDHAILLVTIGLPLKQ